MSLPPLKWAPSPNFSTRHGARVDLLVLHDTEGGYAGAISWFKNPKSQVSAHFVIKEDGAEATQMVDLADKAWHAKAFNPRSIGFEMAGIAAKGFGEPEWAAAASIFAFHLHHLQIPNRWARAGVGPGFCSHFDLGVAGGGHRDPTVDPKVWQHFVDLVTQQYDKAAFPPIWESERGLKPCGLTPAAAVPAIAPLAKKKAAR
jgi:hypothetical protein